MTGKERIISTLQYIEPDRVPTMEFAIDYWVIEKLLGRKSLWRGKLDENIALWDGLRDEVVESQKRDIVDFIRETGMDGVAVHLVQPKGFMPEKLKQLDAETWRDWRGNLYRHSAQTHDLMIWKLNALDAEPAPDLWEAPAEIDESEWEVIDYVLQELGDTHYIAARPGRRLSCTYPSAIEWEPMMMRMAEEPDKVRQERIDGALSCKGAFDIYLERGCDNIIVGDDFGHNHGPFVSPANFAKIYVPGIKITCEIIHELGVPVLWHACGDNRIIIDQMISSGIDCYQAIQPEEDIVALREKWGHQLALWGGVSTHSFVTATPDEIREETRRAIAGCAPGGGFILGSSHSLCVQTKAENVMAMMEEVERCGWRDR